ncbi:MAG: plasmid mobilization relaxosome protein MobC, partial [Alphaproteobacteria bacterium]|nr:plasmid mobilization relaxosome protein MobC [Alphaproteobacteria bacterium]
HMKRGRPRKSDDDIRRRRDIWLSDLEWDEIQLAAELARLPVRVYARRLLLKNRITAAPSVQNLAAWSELARLAGNLNQIARHANETGQLRVANEVAEVSDVVARLRAELIGATANRDPEINDEKIAEVRAALIAETNFRRAKAAKEGG